MRIFWAIFLLTFIFSSCRYGNGDENALATYKNEALYLSDIEQSFPENMEEEDSVKLLKKIVDNWLSRQLLYDRAMGHQLHDEDDIEYKVEKYKQNLIIHQYKSQLLSEKIDTTVTLQQIKEYYDNHSDEFRLRENIARVYFVKLPKSIPNAYKVRQWMQSSDNEDKLIELKEFSYQNARFYDFDNQWIDFESVNNFLPEKVEDEKAFLERYRIYQKRDSLYWYFLRMNEYLLKGDIPPMDYIISDIRQIILSKRKIDYIKQLENNLKREAQNNKKIKINI
ncbi:MAG TPA: hypothetical protein VJ937_07725 [Salinivirga sp.]|uniref:hypothetical protein n=1 Tax=Salinivirga sp. TaxID=1970192 RepID=UPI002B490863|nr:hypothetical protein [Salinivirga sp.]HKK59352.1 hypothetical protein [Salinivirga sp.]